MNNMLADSDMIKVSVIVPIYGVEKYIQRCVHSLMRQTMKDCIEFIFVNDATPDNSMQLLSEVLDCYPQRKNQVKIIEHTENKGLAVTRVTGLMAARGEYVAHCDSDDWVEPSMYIDMYNLAKKDDADIVVCDYLSESNDGNLRIFQYKENSREKITSSLLKFESMHPFLWIRLIKRKFYCDGKFFADRKISFCEDLAVTIPMHLSTDNVSLLSKALYHYNVVNSGSMTQERSLKKIESCKLAMDKIEEFILSHGYESVLPALEYRRFLYFIPLITCLESYNPHRWLELDNPNININLMIRSRISVWLVRHRLFKLNKLLQVFVRKIFKK